MRRSTASTRSRGTITSRTRARADAEDVAEDAARCRAGSRRRRAPPRPAARAPPASAPRAPAPSCRTPSARTSALPVPFITRSIGRNTRPKISSGCAQASATGPGPVERDRLRRQLAHDHVQEGDEREGQRRSRASAPRRATRSRRERSGGSDQPRQRRLADEAEPDARERDAELRGGDGVVEACRSRAAAARAPRPPGLHPQLDLRAAHGDERELGGDEVGVQQDQRGDGRAGRQNGDRRARRS